MATSENRVGKSVLLPRCEQPVVLPLGWDVRFADPLVCIGPEKDLRLALLVASARADIETLAQDASGANRPCFQSSSSATGLKVFVALEMEQGQVPGVAIGIVQSGRVVFAEGFGVRAFGSTGAVTPETRLMIGSTTKPLTTLIMARLVDLGAFTWNTPTTELLPDFELGDSDLTRQMQVRHTECACTGMPRRDVDFVFHYKDVSAEQRLAEMKTMHPTTGFGETFQYSNLLVAAGGYASPHRYKPALPLAAAYQAALQDLVFDPLQMSRTLVDQSEAIEGNDLAVPHSLDLYGQITNFDSP